MKKETNKKGTMKKWKVWVQYETEIKADSYNDALNMGVNEWELNYGQVIEENKNSIKNSFKAKPIKREL
jgi:hypothetical protein